MAVKITYFVHGTTTDNERHLSTGWNPGELSDLGRRQCEDLKQQIKDSKFDAVFCSDLKRATESAEITFGKGKIIPDKRLRECNYGDLNGASSDEVETLVLQNIEKQFPNGESYRDVEKRITSFLKMLLENYDGKSVAIVAHKAPQLVLDVLLKGKTYEQAIKEDWRIAGKWQPGWNYELDFKSLGK